MGLKSFLELFLSRSWRTSNESVLNEPDVTPLLPHIADNVRVARFSFDERDFGRDGSPKGRAFKPELFEGRYETSVCGLGGNVLPARMWALGRMIRARENKVAAAATILQVHKVLQAGMTCEPAPMPDFDEHGVILGWAAEKDRRLDQMNALAFGLTKADVHRPPIPE